MFVVSIQLIPRMANTSPRHPSKTFQWTFFFGKEEKTVIKEREKENGQASCKRGKEVKCAIPWNVGCKIR